MARGIEAGKDEANKVPLVVMEKAIVEIAEGARKLLGSKLSKRAVLVLLKDASGQPMNVIEEVLDNAAKLDKLYLK